MVKLTYMHPEFIVNISKYNGKRIVRHNEKLLLELINKSNYFSSTFGSFEKPSSESHGENDAVCMLNGSNSYGIDFKLGVTASYSKALSMWSAQNEITQIENSGEIIIKRGVCKSYPRISHVCYTEFLGLVNDFIENNSNKLDSTQKNDIENIKKILCKQKNIMLFLPVEVAAASFSKVEESLQSVFYKLYKYRAVNACDFDTYFVFIFNNRFYICTFNSKLNVLDCIKADTINEYKKITSALPFWWFSYPFINDLKVTRIIC